MKQALLILALLLVPTSAAFAYTTTGEVSGDNISITSDYTAPSGDHPEVHYFNTDTGYQGDGGITEPHGPRFGGDSGISAFPTDVQAFWEYAPGFCGFGPSTPCPATPDGNYAMVFSDYNYGDRAEEPCVLSAALDEGAYESCAASAPGLIVEYCVQDGELHMGHTCTEDPGDGDGGTGTTTPATGGMPYKDALFIAGVLIFFVSYPVWGRIFSL